MESLRMQECTICGEERSAAQTWFLLAESHWEDRLKVLQWDDELAKRRGIYAACGAEHVEEMVIHWMMAGSLDYPFAPVGLKVVRRRQRLGSILPAIEEADTRGARLIGELAVDRESVRRALREDPNSLRVILDELVHALERENTGTGARFESADAMSHGFPRQI